VYGRQINKTGVTYGEVENAASPENVSNLYRACSDPIERERESAKFLLFCTFFALLDPNTSKCKRPNATVILLIMD
jgi:hypothetical protein